MTTPGALQRIIELNRLVWCDDFIGETARKLLADITEGITR
jgi:hypothetical protein